MQMNVLSMFVWQWGNIDNFFGFLKKTQNITAAKTVQQLIVSCNYFTKQAQFHWRNVAIIKAQYYKSWLVQNKKEHQNSVILSITTVLPIQWDHKKLLSYKKKTSTKLYKSWEKLQYGKTRSLFTGSYGTLHQNLNAALQYWYYSTIKRTKQIV